MTIATTGNAVTSTGDGTTKAFPFSYRFLSESHLSVYVDGTLKTYGSDYAVTGAGSASGGTVTFVVAPEDGAVVTIERDVPFTQDTDLENFDGYPADVMETALDRIVMMIQRLASLNGKALSLSATSAVASAEIPEPSTSTQLIGINSADGPVLVSLSSISSAFDAIFSTPAAGHFVVHDGAQWVNRLFLGPKGTSIASAATTDLGSANSDFVSITGTATITSLGSSANRSWVCVRFDDAATLTHHATNLILPGGGNITTASGDTALFIRLSGSAWACLFYSRASGLPLAVKDEDDMASDSAAHVPTQHSVKAYFDSLTSNSGRFPLCTYNASASSDIQFKHGVDGAVLDGTYQAYEIEISGAVVSADGATLRMQLSTDAGSSWDSGASDYQWQSRTIYTSSSSHTVEQDQTEAYIRLASGVGNDASESVSGTIRIPAASAARRTLCRFDFTFANSSGNLTQMDGSGMRAANQDTTGVRIYPDSGNFVSGTFTLYGLKTA